MNELFTKKRFSIFFAFILAAGIFSACKKSDPEEIATAAVTTTGVPATGSRKQLTLDSIFLYAKQIYFWNDALPEYSVFNPRQYSGKSLDLDNYDDELYTISQLKKNPATGTAYEFYDDGYPKYSYINDKTQDNPDATANVKNKASVDTEGNGFDIGIRPIFYLTSNSNSGPYVLLITAVYPGSSAASNNVKRGWQIQRINNVPVSGANYAAENAAIVSSLAASSVKIEGVNYIDKVPFNVTLTKTSYKSSPVYASSVITRAGKKIGYLAFARFSTLTNTSAPSDVNLDPVFASFAAAGVTDLVVDLRYNGGGYINTAEYLANLIAPASLEGKTMYTEIYNSTMQAKTRTTKTILSNQPLLTSDGKVQREDGKIVTYDDLDYSAAGNTTNFSKKGSLNSVKNLVFIVSSSTASASELLINAFKPYFTGTSLQLVGRTTYGKPVGFFPITLENRYEVYMPLFETQNANKEGGYYTGMVPGTTIGDNSMYPFGDEREQNLAAALNLIAPGSSSQAASSAILERGRAASLNYTEMKPVNPNSEFNGMIESRRSIKK
jgi:carboxyl-terminal processing protease